MRPSILIRAFVTVALPSLAGCLQQPQPGPEPIAAAAPTSSVMAGTSADDGHAACGAPRPKGLAGTVVRDVRLVIKGDPQSTYLYTSGCIRVFFDDPVPAFAEINATAYFLDAAGRILGRIDQPATTLAVPAILTGAPQTVLQDRNSASVLFNENLTTQIGYRIAHSLVHPQVLFVVTATPLETPDKPDTGQVTLVNFVADACVIDESNPGHPTGTCPDLPGTIAHKRP